MGSPAGRGSTARIVHGQPQWGLADRSRSLLEHNAPAAASCSFLSIIGDKVVGKA